MNKKLFSDMKNQLSPNDKAVEELHAKLQAVQPQRKRPLYLKICAGVASVAAVAALAFAVAPAVQEMRLAGAETGETSAAVQSPETTAANAKAAERDLLNQFALQNVTVTKEYKTGHTLEFDYSEQYNACIQYMNGLFDFAECEEIKDTFIKAMALAQLVAEPQKIKSAPDYVPGELNVDGKTYTSTGIGAEIFVEKLCEVFGADEAEDMLEDQPNIRFYDYEVFVAPSTVAQPTDSGIPDGYYLIPTYSANRYLILRVQYEMGSAQRYPVQYFSYSFRKSNSNWVCEEFELFDGEDDWDNVEIPQIDAVELIDFDYEQMLKDQYITTSNPDISAELLDIMNRANVLYSNFYKYGTTDLLQTHNSITIANYGETAYIGTGIDSESFHNALCQVFTEDAVEDLHENFPWYANHNGELAARYADYPADPTIYNIEYQITKNTADEVEIIATRYHTGEDLVINDAAPSKITYVKYEFKKTADGWRCDEFDDQTDDVGEYNYNDDYPDTITVNGTKYTFKGSFGNGNGVAEIAKEAGFTAYSIDTITPEVAIAVQFDGESTKKLYYAQACKPETLGDLVNALGLKSNLKIGVLNSEDERAALELIFKDLTLKTLEPYDAKNQTTATINFTPSLNLKYGWMRISRDGYLTLDLGIYFNGSYFIGTETANELVDVLFAEFDEQMGQAFSTLDSAFGDIDDYFDDFGDDFDDFDDDFDDFDDYFDDFGDDFDDFDDDFDDDDDIDD